MQSEAFRCETEVLLQCRASSVASEQIDDLDVDDDDSLRRSTTKTVPQSRPATAASSTPKGRGNGKGKGRAKTPPLSKNFVSTVPWPEHFKALQKTFQAINTVYTFLSARKHMMSTFDTLKSSVEAILKR